MTAARTAAGTAWRDQADAAARHAGRLVDGLTVRAGAWPAVTGDPWLREHLAALLLALVTGTAELCPHLTAAPAVAHAALWAPGRLVCTGCLPALRPDPAEDHTCDRCRRPADAIGSAALHAGPLVIVFGLCPPCARHLHTPEGTAKDHAA
ncbi:hypothetical protein ACQEU3_08980 [Spirillospora sp. CA-253888]